MNHLIWKQEVPVLADPHVTVTLPFNARIIHVNMQGFGAMAFWFSFPNVPSGIGDRRRFRVFGTGQEIPEQWEYVGTALDRKNGLVWHLHEWKGKLSE